MSEATTRPRRLGDTSDYHCWHPHYQRRDWWECECGEERDHSPAPYIENGCPLKPKTGHGSLTTHVWLELDGYLRCDICNAFAGRKPSSPELLTLLANREATAQQEPV